VKYCLVVESLNRLTDESWDCFVVKGKVLKNLIALAPTVEENLFMLNSFQHLYQPSDVLWTLLRRCWNEFSIKSLGTDGGK